MGLIREANRKPPGHPQDPDENVLTDAEERRRERIAAARAGQLVWMSAEEGAEYLGVSVSRFNAAAAGGEFDRYKDLGGYRYHRDDLDRWRRSRALPAFGQAAVSG